MTCKYTAQGQYVCAKPETETKKYPIQIEHFASPAYEPLIYHTT